MEYKDTTAAQILRYSLTEDTIIIYYNNVKKPGKLIRRIFERWLADNDKLNYCLPTGAGFNRVGCLDISEYWVFNNQEQILYDLKSYLLTLSSSVVEDILPFE